ncbi:MAG: hypothetical protein KJO07_06540 [Deltaproteobacteria bacterium]|nr:hypothetical protein [Deltaproteobacteria bacterium]
MRVEIKPGQPQSVGSAQVSVVELRENSFLDHEGKHSTKRSAVLQVAGEPVEVEEGSVLGVGGTRTRVIRISARKQLVRLCGADDPPGRFATMVEGFHNAAAPFEASLAFAIEGANIVNDVLSRLDDHPDTVAGFGDVLGRAQKFLQHGRAGLAGSGASQAVLAFVDRYLGLCAPLLDAVLSATHERELAE